MAKGFLLKQIYDVAWYSFFEKMKYKAENADKKLVEVNPNGTSQTCICGETVKKKIIGSPAQMRKMRFETEHIETEHSPVEFG